MDITAATFKTGSNLDVDAAAEQMTATDFPCRRGVTVKAAAANTGIVHVGVDANMTAGTVATTDGFPLSAGDSVTVEVNNVNKIFVFASVANQTVFWIAD